MPKKKRRQRPKKKKTVKLKPKSPVKKITEYKKKPIPRAVKEQVWIKYYLCIFSKKNLSILYIYNVRQYN